MVCSHARLWQVNEKELEADIERRDVSEKGKREAERLRNVVVLSRQHADIHMEVAGFHLLVVGFGLRAIQLRNPPSDRRERNTQRGFSHHLSVPGVVVDRHVAVAPKNSPRRWADVLGSLWLGIPAPGRP